MALVCAGTMGVEEERQSEVTATLLNVRSRAQTQWAKYKVLEELIGSGSISGVNGQTTFQVGTSSV